MSDQFTRPVILGEVLFHTYPDGSRRIGGSPFNVAWFLQGFGQRPFFISRVGQDEYGELTIMAIRQWGMDGLGVQIDANYPTGRAHIVDDTNEVILKIDDNQAYDHINTVLSSSLLRDRDTSLIYTGSLALRHEKSLKAYYSLCLEKNLSRFVDLNLHAPWWKKEDTSRLLQGANWLKVTDNEIRLLVERDIQTDTDLRMATDILRRTYAIETVFVDRGKNGICLCENDAWIMRKATNSNAIIDAGRASDAVSAVCILGIQSGWTSSQILERSMQFAPHACEQDGSNCNDPAVYDRHLGMWQK